MKSSNRNSIFLGLLLCCWVFLGCEKEVIVPGLEGNIVGYLYTFDEFGIREEHGDVIVKTTGLDGSYTAYSDEEGRYEFQRIPSGTYELVFTKEGFASEKLSGVRHLGGKPTILGYDQYYRMTRLTSMYKIPGITVQTISLENDTLIAFLNFAETPPGPIALMLYFSDQNGFQNNSSIITSQYFLYHNGIYKSQLIKERLPFAPGQTVYLRAAVLSRGYTTCATIDNEGNYIQCDDGIKLNPVLGNESQQFSIVFPE